MEEAQESGITIADVLDGELKFPKPWPTIPPSHKMIARRPRDTTQAAVPFLVRIAAGRSGVAANEAVAQHLDLLDKALEDRRMIDSETKALEQTAEAWGLSAKQVDDAHEIYFRVWW